MSDTIRQTGVLEEKWMRGESQLNICIYIYLKTDKLEFEQVVAGIVSSSSCFPNFLAREDCIPELCDTINPLSFKLFLIRYCQSLYTNHNNSFSLPLMLLNDAKVSSQMSTAKNLSVIISSNSQMKVFFPHKT